MAGGKQRHQFGNKKATKIEAFICVAIATLSLAANSKPVWPLSP